MQIMNLKFILIQPSNACGPFRDIDCEVTNGNASDCVVYDYVTYLIENGDAGLKDVSQYANFSKLVPQSFTFCKICCPTVP